MPKLLESFSRLTTVSQNLRSVLTHLRQPLPKELVHINHMLVVKATLLNLLQVSSPSVRRLAASIPNTRCPKLRAHTKDIPAVEA
eukprot:2485404-Amphidinium_carterae.1